MTNIHIFGPSEEAKKKCEDLLLQSIGYFSSYEQQHGDDIPAIIDWSKIKEESLAAQKIKWAKCPELIKDFYEEHREVSRMTEDEVLK